MKSIQSKEDFLKIKSELVAVTAKAIETVLNQMGSDARGIEWFSSSATNHPGNCIEQAKAA